MARARTALAALLAIAASALGACNVVVTKAPLFTRAEASPLKLRDGIWTSPGDSCAFDETRPVDAWPDCASPGLIRNNRFLEWDREAKRWNRRDADTLTIVAGDPSILQVHAATSDGGGFYLYAGLSPKLDASGRIIAMETWPVLCGPPPPPPARSSGGQATVDTATQTLTKAPFPGLVLDEKGQTCTTADTAALRNAAKASRAYEARQPFAIHWVRDGER